MALLVVFFPSVAMATAYALRPVRKPLVVYAINGHHQVLAPNSRLSPGEHVTVVAKGFLSRTRVQVVDISRRKISYVRANRSGVARTAFVVPRRGAQHLSVALDGLIAGRLRSNDFSADAKRDRQTFVTSVPLLRRYPYRLPGSGAGGRGVDAGGVGLGPGTQTGEGGGSGLANTGTDVLALLAGAILLVVLGAAVSRSNRRRPRPGNSA